MDDLLQPSATATPPARSGGRNVLQVLWQHRALVLLGLVLGGTVGLLNYSQRPPVYRASAQLLVIKKQNATTIITDKENPNARVMDDYVSTHLFVLRSPTIVSRAVAKRNLGALKSLQGGNPVGTIQGGLRAEREVNKDAPAGSSSNIINLSYSGSDPADAEAVLTAVIESYKDFLDETYKNTSEATVGLIQSAIDNLTNTLSKKEADYREFRKTTVLVMGEKGTPFHETKILDYQRSETAAHEQAAEIKQRIDAIEKSVAENKPREHILALAERKYETGTKAAAKTNEVALHTALFGLMQQEAELLQFYGEDHPEVIRIRKRMELTKEHFKKLDALVAESAGAGADADPVQTALRSLRTELAIRENNRAYFAGMLKGALDDARKLQGDYDKDRGFRDEIARIAKLHEQTMSKLDQIDLVRGSGGFDAKAITPPGPGAKVAPVFWQFLLMGVVLGFGLGAGAAYLLDVSDKSFRTPEEIRRRLGLPLVGHVPFVHKPTDPVRVTDAAGNAVELDPGLATVHSPMSPEAEAYRGVRTALFFNTQGERHKVIQVTSPNMGDGKTTLIMNLAVSIAQSGRKVLLVDADLRRPRVHRAFGVTGRLGLAEVLTGVAELDEAIQVTAIPNLSVLPCGRRPPNPAELLTSPRFEDALDDLREAYDYVLVDSPPLLAVSDPCIVAPRVDGLLLTIRVAKNGRPAAERARDLLTGLKVNCIGVVVNGVGKQGSMAGYGYDHYKYADEYTTPYTTADHDAHADADHPEPAPMEPAARDAQAPIARPRPVLNGAAEPSSNGHGHSPHSGE